MYVLFFQQAESLVRDVVDEKFHCAIPEITVYLKEGIGNQTRIDYGTGQLQFCIFLRWQIGIVLHVHLVCEMTYYVSSGTLNSTHSLTYMYMLMYWFH